MKSRLAIKHFGCSVCNFQDSFQEKFDFFVLRNFNVPMLYQLVSELGAIKNGRHKLVLSIFSFFFHLSHEIIRSYHDIDELF